MIVYVPLALNQINRNDTMRISIEIIHSNGQKKWHSIKYQLPSIIVWNLTSFVLLLAIGEIPQFFDVISFGVAHTTLIARLNFNESIGMVSHWFNRKQFANDKMACSFRIVCLFNSAKQNTFATWRWTCILFGKNMTNCCNGIWIVVNIVTWSGLCVSILRLQNDHTDSLAVDVNGLFIHLQNIVVCYFDCLQNNI